MLLPICSDFGLFLDLMWIYIWLHTYMWYDFLETIQVVQWGVILFRMSLLKLYIQAHSLLFLSLQVLVAEFSYRQGFVANLGIGDYLRRSWKGKTKGGEKRRKRKLERQLNLVKENCSVVETGGMEEIASSFRVQDCYVLWGWKYGFSGKDFSWRKLLGPLHSFPRDWHFDVCTW